MAPSRSKRPTVWLPIALVALSAIPVLAGAARLAGLVEGVRITPDNARFFDSPAPVALHVVCASVFSVLGAWQFSAGLRRRHPARHRRAGRLLVGCGLVTGLSGLWMTAFYPRVAGDGAPLDALRWVFGGALCVCLVLGSLAIRRGDLPRHGAFMTRGYAIAMGAGTQALLHLPWLFASAKPAELTHTLLMGAGWLLNLAVAECVIRSAASRARPHAAPSLAAPRSTRLAPARR